jgi:hypothetical protein
MLDAPVSGGAFFEQVTRDNLDIGGPDQVTLIFDGKLIRRSPRATPGRFRARVITEGYPQPARPLQTPPDQAVPQARDCLTHIRQSTKP